MLCVVCKGSGCLLTTANKLQWWDCPGCGGAGVHATGRMPPTLVVRGLNQALKGKRKKKNA